MINTLRKIFVEKQRWPLEKEFRISRSTRTETEVLYVTISQGDHIGRSEVVPQPRYQETTDSVIAQLNEITPLIENGLELEKLHLHLSAGAARNALDCALWDLKAKLENTSVAKLNSIKEFNGCQTAQTLSIDTVEKMAQSAAELKNYPLIKVKFDTEQVIEKIQAIFKSAPNSQFIIDANESWNIDQLNEFAPIFEKCNVTLIEQPIAEQDDMNLKNYIGRVPLCADESLHTSDDLDRISTLYGCINIKLDKTGGLTEALKLLKAARDKDLSVMVGCMVGTSLAMAPASLVASYADFVDLDGPALLAKDRENGFSYKDGTMSRLNPKLWGSAI